MRSSRPTAERAERDDLNSRVRCGYCGNALRRLARTGFLQKHVYWKFGYYPWECPLCREPVMVRQQHRLKMRSEEHEASMPPRTTPNAAGPESAEAAAGHRRT